MSSERHDHKATPRDGGSAAKRPERDRCIIRIHVAKRELGMSDKDYREALEGQTGKTSCKDMTLSQLYTVEAYFKKLGFKPTIKKRPFAKRKSPVSQGRQVDKIRALWIEMANNGDIRDGSENALEAWVQRMSAKFNHGRGIQKVDWLEQEPYVCSRLLESLKQWQKRCIKNREK
ncbi:regulatory protein GemA [Endozoicomonas gorgoniicola]|uniref:Regulatory protein GemA n=1 Tax=Endozoicomonas gorgoniicola TaxID=1234144 RepID=A0ABT3MUB5_9GAMM|nr:regulatory protein GemA [Endozoicomonas gorgoniicola]MCW7552569.1 regulatory protein GemA [Endozoicomonas gorgoniicola]